MRIAVPKEIRDGEKRVALVPDIISKLTRLGFDVVIESGAGVHSQATDADYISAGATISKGEVLSAADAVLSVQPLTPVQRATLKKGAVTISFMSPVTAVDSIDAAAAAGVTAFSLELVPRISRAQSMDALSSQALCAGYRAALVGAELSPRFFPMLMTAAGTVTPAQVLVLGAGVEMTEDRAAQQQALLTPYIAKSHVVITTAAVPGRQAPRLMTQAMVDSMAPGTIIIDLAAETGGNVEGAKPGEIVTTASGVRIWGGKDVPSQLPFHASFLYSRNVVNLLTLFTTATKDEATVAFNLDFEDEIINGAAVTHGGSRRNAGGK